MRNVSVSQMIFLRFFLILLLVLGAFSPVFFHGNHLTTSYAHADSREVVVRDPVSYSASFVSQSIPDPIVIEAGTTKDVQISFKNTGKKAWVNGGSGYISAYTMEPRYRASEFSGKGWLSNKQTAKMAGTVQPGQVGTITIPLHAPEKVGEYTEKFYLASENSSWVNNGYFFFKIKVVPKTVVAPSVSEQKNDTIPQADGETEKTETFKAKKLGQTVKEISATGGEMVKVVVIYQNTGDSSWEGHSLHANSPVALAGTSGLTFATPDWESHTVVSSDSSIVEPFGTIRKEFYISAPKKKGNYTATLSLYSGSGNIEGSGADINIHVTENAPLSYVAPSFGSIVEEESVQEPTISSLQMEEPRIRVGMELPMDYVQFKGRGDYRVVANGIDFGIIPAGRLAVIAFDGVYYKVKAHELEYIDVYPPRLEPVENEHEIFELLNYDRHVKWKGPNNFNTYRGAFEYQRGKVDQKMYAVNDLLMSDYVAGIGETSNAAPIEYIKALLTAARTYAYMSKNKYPFFDVLGNTYDQLYLGYESERLMPNVAKAANETRGYYITYDNKIVITPYFANSTGRTITWRQAWGGTDKPWLQPVSANYDIGQPLRGHGVGMSARDAAIRADKEGVDWKYLVKYYYTGTQPYMLYTH